MSMLAGGWHLPLLFLCATKLRKVLCHFWWQKWRKSHAPHLWRRRESQSLKRMLRRQSVCRLRFFTPLRLSSAATDKSVAYPPTMRRAGFRCALGARVLKKIPVNRGGGARVTRVTRVTGETGVTRKTGETRILSFLFFPVLLVFPVFPLGSDALMRVVL